MGAEPKAELLPPANIAPVSAMPAPLTKSRRVIGTTMLAVGLACCSLSYPSTQRCDDLANQRRALIDHARVELDEVCTPPLAQLACV